MTVHCPQCLTGYVIPENLLGPGGARVRCPECSEEFVVVRDGVTAAGEGAPEGAGDEAVIAEAMSGAASGSGAGPAEAAETGTAVAAVPEVAESPAPTADRGRAPEAPDLVAGAVLGVLTDFLGESLTRSRARGTVLSDHGPAIMAVFDEYRRRAGADAPSQIFRAALRDHCGVDLSRVNGG
jgi:predicted Zn finger-like uncharacterized protein